MYLRDRFQKFLAAATAGMKGPGAERGISLAEISGVLVVGGLIIAGALKGGELIKISQIRGGIAEVQKIQSATATFVEQTEYLPGDYPLADVRLGGPIGITWTADGDGDGIIDGDGVTAETVYFWQHLAASKLITGIELDAAPLTSGSVIFGVSLPANPIGGGLTVVRVTLNDNPSHWLRLGTAQSIPTGVVNADTAKVIDKKIDDGRPGTGSVQTVDTVCVTASGPTGNYQQAGAAAATAAVDCLLNFDLGS